MEVQGESRYFKSEKLCRNLELMRELLKKLSGLKKRGEVFKQTENKLIKAPKKL